MEDWSCSRNTSYGSNPTREVVFTSTGLMEQQYDMATLVKEGKIVTFTNKVVDLFNPQPESFNIEDIAQGLALQPRFGGQIRTFYSIAQHSVYVSQDLRGEQALWGLLHDASEAYIQDLVTPLKYNIPLYREVEGKMMAAIAVAFSLPEQFLLDLEDKTSMIKQIDTKQFLWEWQHLKVGNGVKGWLPEEAKKRFLARYNDLLKKAAQTGVTA